MFNFTNTNKNRQQELPAAPASSGANQQNLGSIEAMAEQKVQEIEAQRIAFAKKNPGFDMKTELENPAFKNYLWVNGLTVEEAYFLAHREELLENARTEALDVGGYPAEGDGAEAGAPVRLQPDHRGRNDVPRSLA